MLGSELIKKIVDNDLVDKDITIIGNLDDTSEVETESVQITGVELVQDIEAGIIIIDGHVE